MCRLLLMTATRVNEHAKRLFFHQLMLQNRAESQNDGAGITDGINLLKSGLDYSTLGLQWLPKLDHRLPWMGHVRSMSKGTSTASVLAAHPFYYKESGLIGAHNGFITGTGDSAEGEPNVDSYRALKDLSQRIVKHRGLDQSVLKDWIQNFGPYSEWAFMLRYRDDSWVIRGIRHVYWLRIDDGYLFCTSYNSLALFVEWVQMFWPDQFNMSNIRDMAEYQAAKIDSTGRLRWINLPARERAPDPLLQYCLKGGEETLYEVRGV
jgi:predicted glutamine amidotransferase